MGEERTGPCREWQDLRVSRSRGREQKVRNYKKVTREVENRPGWNLLMELETGNFKEREIGGQDQTLQRRQVKRCHEKGMIHATHIYKLQII